jgi:DNA-binding transcriptional regulator YiaG
VSLALSADSVSLVKAALDTVNQDRERLAFRLGVSVHTVRRWIYGDRKPNFEATQKLIRMVTP